MANSSTRSPQRSSGNVITRFLIQRPLFLWGSVWVSMLVVGLVALNGLLSPGSSNGSRSTGAALSSGAASMPSDPNGGRIPLWLFGAIALSCTAGSVLVSRQLARPAPFSRTSKPFPKPTLPTPAPPPSQKETKPRRLSSYVATEFPFPYSQPLLSRASTAQTHRSTTVTPPKPHKAPSAKLPDTARPIAQTSSEVPVAVVPSDENHPLDWGNASLADKLDIRKQRSVSSWL